MTTIVIKSKSKAAIQMINFLKTQPYAKVIDTEEPNEKTAEAIQNVIEGKNLSKSHKNAEQFFKAHNI